MKRPPGIWILLSAGVLWLSLQDVYGIRATSLIFGKTTTTTTTPGPVPNVTDSIDAEVVTESSTESNGKNSSKPALTGNPQLDYIHDPNLPKELNGYNLSEYPFYERVPDPDEIDFKCDGLHDGFYASITFKCQVYHHCLFGTRYDFLCANYTAFDQKTFICQFVSDVDCVGSKKFWHRNDALYQAASTTTLKPTNIYTTAPPAASQQGGGGNPRAGGKRRRPLLRRPQYDYYDDYADYEEDYYEDRPRSNRRRRPRPRPRPVYEDEYDEEYMDEEYERRNRRPYNRRGSSGRRNKNRNKNRDSDEDYTEKPKDRKKSADEDNDNRQNERRKPSREVDNEDDRSNVKRKPQRYDNEDARPRKHSDDDEFEDDRTNEKRKPIREDNLEDDYDSRRPSKKTKRPPVDDDYEDVPRNRENRPRKGTEDESEKNNQGSKPLIVPTTGTIYDKPRVAPRIKPPVPKNEANKYAYKPIKATTPSYDEEYYDDYEEELPTKPTRSRKPQPDPITPKSSEIKERKSFFTSRNRMKVTVEEESSTNRVRAKPDESSSRIRTTLDEEDDALTLPPKRGNRGKDRYRSTSNTKSTESIPEDEDKKFNEEDAKTVKIEQQNRNTPKSKQYPDPEYYDSEYESEKTKADIVSTSESPRKRWRPSESSTSTTPKTISRKPTASSTEFRKERPDQIVRIVKRPFLPSRGGNPYVARGLQPVGFKAARQEIDESRKKENIDEKSKVFYADEQLQQINTKPRYNPGSEPSGFEIGENSKPNIESSIRGDPIRNSVKSKFSEPISEDDDDFKPIKRPSRPSHDGNTYGGPRTTQKPKVPDRNPLDINEQEYDVTLNDALNPTLPNLPLKTNFPTGFSPANDYTFSAFQRPRYVIEPILSSANADYVYQPKQADIEQQFETVPQSYSSRGEFLPNPNYYPRIVGANTRRGVVQTQSQPYY